VPLKSKQRTLGTMNIACPGDRYFTEDDFRLLDSIGNHIGLAIENSVLYQDLRQKESLRGQILSQIIEAQEDERKRIARELHDEYGQMLTGLIMSIESAETTTAASSSAEGNGLSRLREKLSNLKRVASEALDGMRRMTLDLRPAMLDDLGLAAAVRAFLQANLEDAGIGVEFTTNTSGESLSPEAKIALYRIIQESVNNIIKYAEASNVRISLQAGEDRITASIEDDGRGFDVDRVYSTRIGAQSLGLLGIQERATLLGGTFQIRSEEGVGTRLTVEIPLTHMEEEDEAASGRTSDGERV
jgi:signal transduction histidine kinase